ncbi:AbrB/MazE/SpoVT family DNA-binding domain-containing protein [Niallia sp. Sow4_A1]|uniref:AbrB/MazE/SpoVT family DNA-binding domain-containing protein n=1 Tax=unclassified Niallia TaxID=2837522 RepID=UPI003F8C4BCA
MYNKLLKSGQVTIPNKAQKHIGIQDGDSLYLYQEQDHIVIVKHHTDHTLNKCIFHKGKISIPAELRRLLGISVGTLLEININNKHNKIIINIVKQNLLKDVQ